MPHLGAHTLAFNSQHHVEVIPALPPQGTIPKISDLPAPWGNKPSPIIPEEELTRAGYLPAKYPQGFNPLTDIAA